MSLRSEDGFSLVETLIAIVIMSILMVAILGGMGTSTAASGTHRRQAEAIALLTSSAERLKSELEVPYVTCATPATTAYIDAVQASQLPGSPLVKGTDLSIDRIAYWQGGSTFDPDVANCRDGTTPILRIQKITLRVVSGNVDETISILKRGTP